MSIATTLRANDPAALRSISGWAHDGMLLDGGIDYVPDDATVEIRFEQEPLDPNLALPAPELVRRSWWGTEYRMPFVLCRLTIRHATARPAMALDPASLVDVAWLAAAAVVRVDTAVGPIDVHTRSLDVRLEITDEVVSVRRRRVGRLIGWDATGGPL